MRFLLETALLALLSQQCSAGAVVTVPLTYTGTFYTAPMSLGGQKLNFLIDSGSSSLWVATEGFKCLNSQNASVIPQSECDFGTLYQPNKSSSSSTLNQHISLGYGNGDYITGSAATESVSIEGIEFPNMTFMEAAGTVYQGDGFISGIWGFAYPAFTYLFNGPKGSLTDQSTKALLTSSPYAPFVLQAADDGIIDPIVGLALNAGSKYGDGGVMTLGGAPNVSVSSPWATVPIQKTAFKAGSNGRITDATARPPLGNDTYDYGYYTIQVEGLSLKPANGSAPKMAPEKYMAFVDSGAPTTAVSLADAVAINSAFVPPAIYSASEEAFLTSCNATPPTLSFTIGNTSFVTNPATMLAPLPNNPSMCMSTIVNSTAYTKVIGNPFLSGVVAVFDQGNNTLSLASTLAENNSSSGKPSSTGGSSSSTATATPTSSSNPSSSSPAGTTTNNAMRRSMSVLSVFVAAGSVYLVGLLL